MTWEKMSKSFIVEIKIKLDSNDGVFKMGTERIFNEWVDIRASSRIPGITFPPEGALELLTIKECVDVDLELS